jgi:hypothetical protein
MKKKNLVSERTENTKLHARGCNTDKTKPRKNGGIKSGIEIGGKNEQKTFSALFQLSVVRNFS